MATKFFSQLDDNSTNWTKNNLLNKFLTDASKGVHVSMSVSDLGIYSGSTKIQTIETTLSIGNNPTVGGAVTGTARTGATLTAAAVSDLDGINGDVTWQFHQRHKTRDPSKCEENLSTHTKVLIMGGHLFGAKSF